MLYLPLLVLLVASLALVMAWQDSKNNTEKVVMVLAFLLVAIICFRSCDGLKNNLLEGFEVQIPDVDEHLDSSEYDGNNSFLDVEEQEEVQGSNNKTSQVKFNSINNVLEFDNEESIEALKSKKPKTVTDEFADIVQQDTHGKHNSVFNPQIVINAPQGSVETGENLLNNLMKANENDYTTSFRDNTTSQNNNAMANNFENIRTHNKTISEYLKPSPELFENNDNTNSTNNEDNVWDEYIKKQNENIKKGKGACAFSYPYAEDSKSQQNDNGFDPKTLTTKTFVPGMQYLPPTNWDVPQYHPNNCRNVCPTRVINTRELPIGVMDYGTPINALELGQDGTIAKTESDVSLTNVGSMLPKFVYREFIECPANQYQGSIPADVATTHQRPTTTTIGNTTTTRGNTTTTRGNTTTTSSTIPKNTMAVPPRTRNGEVITMPTASPRRTTVASTTTTTTSAN